MFQLHSDCLISIFIISEHGVKEYKCLFSRVGNGGAWVRQLLGDRAHAKSVNRSVWKMNGVFWSSLRFCRMLEVAADVFADVDVTGG